MTYRESQCGAHVGLCPFVSQGRTPVDQRRDGMLLLRLPAVPQTCGVGEHREAPRKLSLPGIGHADARAVKDRSDPGRDDPIRSGPGSRGLRRRPARLRSMPPPPTTAQSSKRNQVKRNIGEALRSVRTELCWIGRLALGACGSIAIQDSTGIAVS
jgi:hypothetical protein